MNIKSITLKNWMCYAGEQTIQLTSKAYAIVASRDGNQDASNMAGKTALMEAIAFALYGQHRFRTEDEWITRGQNEGSVDIETDDGWLFSRERKIGDSTRLKASRLENGVIVQTLQKQEAQDALEKALGFSQSDWYATCTLEQRQMARFVLAKPEERMKMVEGWFELGKLQMAANEVANKRAALQVQLTKWQTLAEMELKEPPEAMASAEEHQIQKWEEELKVVEAQRVQVQRRREQEARVNEATSRLNLAKEALSKLEKPDAEAQASAVKEYTDAQQAKTRAEDTYRRLKQVTRGEFGGECPVTQSQCPVKEQINAGQAEAKVKLEVATQEFNQVSLHCSKLSQVSATLVQNEKRYATQEALLKQLHTQLHAEEEKLLSLPAKLVTYDAELEQSLKTRIGEAHARKGFIQAQRAEYQATLERKEEARKQLEKVRNEMLLLNAAEAIFNRNGAQRLIAERALGVIESVANAMLIQGGIPLNVSMRWGREGQGHAKTCSACGAAFPTSARVKVCTECGAQRGQHVVPKLEVELSDRSGAAEDMAGLAMQLAASAWLRKKRNARWAVALVDEPFGACDVYNRRALGKQLAALLTSTYGFEQAFVIAHSTETLDAMPGRIEVAWKDGRSTLKVVA